MNLIFAGQNQGKLKEFVQTFEHQKIPINLELSPVSYEVEETGKTLQENALIKAEYYFKQNKKPSISDDSGLFVHSLPDQLGVDTAYFGGPAKLLEILKNQSDRQAYFFSCLCVYLNSREIYFFEGKLKGTILYEEKGTNGFGYDPIFSVDGEKSLAELPTLWKIENSHRTKAINSLKRFFFPLQSS